MGLYDYITCKRPLPARDANDKTYQTKDLPAYYLDRYEIREDGTLWHEAYDYDAEADPGYKQANKRWEREKLTGEVRFYDDKLEFSAYFIEGELKHLVLIEDLR